MTLYVGMGPVFSVFGVFDTPETHRKHVQNLILIAEWNLQAKIHPLAS